MITISARLAPVLAIGMLLYPGRGAAQNSAPARSLEFYTKIGVGFRPGVYGWMSFVAFSPDGTMVASDGPATPEDVSGKLSIWSFPEGRLIQKLSAGKPRVLSPDWKYYATFTGVTELWSGRHAAVRLFAFSNWTPGGSGQ